MSYSVSQLAAYNQHSSRSDATLVAVDASGHSQSGNTNSFNRVTHYNGNTNSFNESNTYIGLVANMYSSSTTDHGAVQAGIQTAQMALSSVKEQVLATLAYSEAHTRFLLTHFEKRLDITLAARERHWQKMVRTSQRKELEAQSQIWAMLPDLSPQALREHATNYQTTIQKSLLSLEEEEAKDRLEEAERVRRESIISHNRTQKLELAKGRIVKIFSELDKKATKSQKPLTAYLFVPLLFLLPTDLKTATALFVFGALIHHWYTNSVSNSIQSRKQSVVPYKVALERLQADADLTIREAFRLASPSTDFATLIRFPNVLVEGDEQNDRVEINPELNDFVTAARKSASLLD